MWGFTPKQEAPVQHDWYYHADPMERREYDAFGPWISTIRTKEEMPPRFRHAYEELQSSTFLFKIPINAERRAMRPGMDLYRSVLAIDQNRVVVLEWNGSTETRYESPMDSIQAVRIDQDLLPANLSLLLADGQTVSLGYNSVSDKEIERVVNFLRERMNTGAGSAHQLPTKASLWSKSDIREHYFLGLWEKHVRRFPSTRILYWEPPGISCGRLRSSLGCLLLDVGSELVIIHRGRFIRRWLEAVYSGAELYVPWATVQAVDLVRKPTGRKSFIPTVRLIVPGHAIDLELFAPTSEHQQLLAKLTAKMAR